MIQKLIFEMKDEKGILGKVETRALGRNIIIPAIVSIHRYGLNRMYEMRTVFGVCSLLLVVALACTYFVPEVQRMYIKIDKIAEMTEVELEEEVQPKSPGADSEREKLDEDPAS